MLLTIVRSCFVSLEPQLKCEVWPIPLQEVFTRNNEQCVLKDNSINVTQCRGGCGDSMEYSKLNFTFFPQLLEFKFCQCCSAQAGVWQEMTVECMDNTNRTFSAWIHTSCICGDCTTSLYCSMMFLYV